jgi:hypothetical protein
VLVSSVGGRPTFALFAPAEDVDEDGVPNVTDRFPTDPAAAQDTDGDGSPDTWNPGMGPEDSTSGLSLDAFPDDFACQLAAHGVAGVCDFELVIPSEAGAPLCEIDEPALSGQGILPSSPVSDFVPLCSGWVLAAERDEYRVVARHLISGRLGLVAPLPSTPGDLELDAEALLLYVAQPDDHSVVSVELPGGPLETFAVPGNPASVSLGADGDLWITSGSLGLARLHLLPGSGSGVQGNWPIVGLHVQYDESRNQLFSMEDNPNYAALYRYRWDGVAGPVWLQSRSPMLRAGNALALSLDGQHLIVAGDETGPSRFVTDFAPWNLSLAQGSWPMAEMPQAIAFDGPGARLAATSRSELSVFDFTSHVFLGGLAIPSCEDGAVPQVGFSRGGGLVIAKQECGRFHTSTTFHWLRVE